MKLTTIMLAISAIIMALFLSGCTIVQPVASAGLGAITHNRISNIEEEIERNRISELEQRIRVLETMIRLNCNGGRNANTNTRWRRLSWLAYSHVSLCKGS